MLIVGQECGGFSIWEGSLCPQDNRTESPLFKKKKTSKTIFFCYMLNQHGLAGLAQSHHDLDTWKFDSCDTSGHSVLAASSIPKA